ncbi:MAG: NAD-dependent malic enzyme [Chloroflexota bacterium]
MADAPQRATNGGHAGISPTLSPSISYTVTLRLEYPNFVGSLRAILTVISRTGGDVGNIEIVHKDRDRIVREISFAARDMDHARRIVVGIKNLPEMRILEARDMAFEVHRGGKIAVESRVPLRNQNDLSLSYTPGVARVSRLIHEEPDAVWTLTSKGNTVAVVTNGSAVLGLGDIGPSAALPVMEGKAILFKEFAGVDAWPICLATKDPDEFVRAVQLLATGFGGINMEDVAAPLCFEIEARLKATLDIPVMHDDQHGTAIVVLAALLNATRVVGKRMSGLKVVINGIGAAGTACGNILMQAGVQNVIGVDRKGVLCAGAGTSLNDAQEAFAVRTNPERVKGTLHDALRGADLFIGVSGPGVINQDDLRAMAKDPIIFAMANPDPEISPEDAAGLARVIATGRSDYPNQINNVLAFPGMFRGALDCHAREINDAMKLAAAEAIAAQVSEDSLNERCIIPSVFQPGVAQAVARAVVEAAWASGVAREIRTDFAVYQF